MKIFDQLKGLKSAASFEELIPRLKADLANAEAEVRKLEARREDAIFSEGEAGIAKLQKDIAIAKDRAETLRIAAEGAERRKLEAEAAENKAALEARSREAAKLGSRERQLLRQWHAAAMRLCELTAAVEDVQKEIAAENAHFGAAGRPDLKIPSIARELAEKRLAALQEIDPGQHVGHATVPRDYLLDHGLKVANVLILPTYWPAPKVDANKQAAFGPILQHLG